MADELHSISWPGWETVRLIGRGSFGAVYEIQRKVFGDVEKAALKVISIPQSDSDVEALYSEGYDDESITDMFQSQLKSIVAEYSLMRKMNGCANIVNCDDVRYVQHDNGIGWDIFIKMDLLTPLTKALPAETTEETVVKIAKDLCNALIACQKFNVIHRDIKPQNIYVSQYGDYKLGDFGIAKTVEKTMAGTKVGTPRYMAPEVSNYQPYGAAADIYSLGLVLYWLLNERRMPFMPLPPAKLTAGVDEEALIRRLSGEKISAPKNGSKKLQEIVLKACAYDPKDRYFSAEEMLNDLNDLDDPERRTPYIFASYAVKDRDVVLPIIQKIEEDGFRVWYAPRDVVPGASFAESIVESIQRCAAFLLFVSAASQASTNCLAELEYAVSMRKKIVPVLVEECALQPSFRYFLTPLQWLHFSEGEHFYQRLYQGLGEFRLAQADFQTPKKRIEIFRDLFDDRIAGRTIPLNEIKVVFLGDGEAGKSHTIARLRNNCGRPKDYTDKTTPGVVIKNKEYKISGRKIKVHFWDFGGQEILHSMHRIFLTERTLYVVLVNARDETQDARAQYWLHNIQSFAPDAPVILVMNKMDQNPNASLNERNLRSKYPGLKRVIKISALKDSESELNRNLLNPILEEIADSGVLDNQWRVPWVKVKTALENMKTDFIDGREYRRICAECGIGEDPEEQKELLHWFNDLGISFCCCDDYKLDNYVILQPDWITNALYIILFNVCVGAKNGLLPHESICRMLKPSKKDREKIRSVLPDITYSYNEVMYVLNVIRKFQLSFEGREDHEFIPMLCQRNSMPVAEEYEQNPDTLEFHMEFEYLPNNVLHRLMVERQQELNMDNVWLTGALFEQKTTGLSAVVTIDGNLLKLFVRSRDPMHRPNTYLSMLKGNIDSIWRQMNLQKPKCMLVYKLNGKQEVFDYEVLTTMLDAGQKQVFSMTWRTMLPIWDILNQSAPAAADDRRKLLTDIVTGCQQLQANCDCWELDENGRNTQVRNALRLRGYVIHDQTLLGISGGEKTAGELDMDIRRYENVPWTICEALRIRDGSKTDWNKHLKKLLDNYNPHGSPFLFLLTYVDSEKEAFDIIWNGFESHIKTHGTDRFAVVPDSYHQFADAQWEDNHYIRTARCQYTLGEYMPAVYHIFVRMGR